MRGFKGEREGRGGSVYPLCINVMDDGRRGWLCAYAYLGGEGKGRDVLILELKGK